MQKQPKRLISIRASAKARLLLDTLSDHLGLTQSGVVELALRRLAEVEKVAIPAADDREEKAAAMAKM